MSLPRLLAARQIAQDFGARRLLVGLAGVSEGAERIGVALLGALCDLAPVRIVAVGEAGKQAREGRLGGGLDRGLEGGAR